MYRIPSVSWVTPKVEIRDSAIGGRGMFAKEAIPTGEKVLEWGGDYVSATEVEKVKSAGKLVMQWDTDLFSVEDRGDDDAYYVNHSCNPSLWMDDAVTLVARRDIKAGEEVTADYAMWEADQEYVSAWTCSCGSKECRGKVTGGDWKLPSLQSAYKNHFSPLINKRIMKLLDKI